MKFNFKQRKGITLVALVITIIILLILAGISIAMLNGENGIITKSTRAKTETEKANVIEQAKIDLLGKQAERKNNEVTKEDFKEILERYFNNVPEAEEIPDDLTDFVLTSKEEYGGQEIKISDIYNETFAEEKQYIEKSQSYVGYYADIDRNGTVDGIIYADLAVDGSGIWNNNSMSNYEYSAVTEGLKNYYISQTGYEGVFGAKDVLTPKGSGEDRFYVMALENITPGTIYCWYDAAYEKLDNLVATNANDFGQGKTNTSNVLTKWKAKDWGAQNDNGTYQDMWGEIEDEIEAGWFVPSKSEWSAFGTNLGVTTTNYIAYGLSDWYWSSSQYDTSRAYTARFNYGYINYGGVNYASHVRLSTTF